MNNYLLKDMPVPSELGSIYESAEQVVDKYVSLYLRLLGNLSVIAEKVEVAVGLPRLEEPSDEPAAQPEAAS